MSFSHLTKILHSCACFSYLTMLTSNNRIHYQTHAHCRKEYESGYATARFTSGDTLHNWRLWSKLCLVLDRKAIPTPETPIPSPAHLWKTLKLITRFSALLSLCSRVHFHWSMLELERTEPELKIEAMDTNLSAATCLREPQRNQQPVKTRIALKNSSLTPFAWPRNTKHRTLNTQKNRKKN